MFWILLTFSLAQGLELVPPRNTWVRDGQNNVTLVCKASEKIRSCSWSTPYGKTYPLESGLMAEAGRLLHYTTDKDKECGVLITNIEDQDSGRWKCNVGVVENSEVTTASGMASLNVATAPDDIFLEQPYASLSSNFTLGFTYNVKCVVKNAKPAPIFTWKIDDEKLDGKTLDEEVFVDTSGLSHFSQELSYIPVSGHANKTLKCDVSHPGLVNNVTAATEVKIVGGEEVIAASSGVSAGVLVGIAIAIIALIGTIKLILMAKQGKFTKKEKKNLDEEKGAIEADAEKPVDPEESHGDAKENNENLEAKKGLNLQAKITALFAAFKPKDKKADEVVATEWEKVDLSDPQTEDKKEETVDNKEEESKELEPEEKEEKTKRIGSETPI